MQSYQQHIIQEYYKIFDKNAMIVDSLHSVFRVLFASKNSVIVSDNRIIRGIAKIRRLDRVRLNSVEEKAIRFLALRDAFALLAKKNVPVYFYNRIGKEKDGYIYSDNENRRMELGLSFPKMIQDIEQYEEDLRDVFKNHYSKEYINEIAKIPQVINVNDYFQHENYHSKYVNVENGKRITTNQPSSYSNTIHIYGRCGAFGYAVEDKDSLPSCIQRKINESSFSDMRVVNHGLWGGEDNCLDHNFIQDSVGMKQGDIVLFYRMHYDKKLISEFEKYGLIYKEITHEWHSKKNEEVTFFDKPGHMNAEGYELVSHIIFEDLIKREFACKKVERDISNTNAEYLNSYLKKYVKSNFADEIHNYVDQINREYPLLKTTENNGSIVMNCNPFTFGHRFLIETASKQVDRLYIFVVEEDKSFFKFADRFDMVKLGTSDLDNVVVVPSGKFIISAYTFPEYFMKDYVKEKNFDVSMDVETFCKYIAPPLNIKSRFAGEEPFDPVTKNYNENMERILPEYGMKFVEIPRLSLDDTRIINATKVRELLKMKHYDELKEYVPESTYKILISRYS